MNKPKPYIYHSNHRFYELGVVNVGRVSIPVYMFVSGYVILFIVLGVGGGIYGGLTHAPTIAPVVPAIILLALAVLFLAVVGVVRLFKSVAREIRYATNTREA